MNKLTGQGVVICSSAVTRNGPLQNILQSIEDVGGCPYPIFVAYNGVPPGSDYGPTPGVHHYTSQEADEYEIGSIKMALRDTDLDEFIFLQDTYEILDADFFPLMMGTLGKATTLHSQYQCYTLKYMRSVLEKMNIPVIQNKRDAVWNERQFNEDYARLARGVECVCPDFNKNGARFERKWGRQNRVIENKYIRKWKGCYNAQMIEDSW